MTDERKKPPPRPPHVRPVEPFRNLTEPSHVEAAATMKDVCIRLDEVLSSHRAIIDTQRRHSLQLDGFGHIINQRFDLFHRELALLRATVTGDHAPRLDEVEVQVDEVKKLTTKQKAAQVALVGTKYTAYLALAAYALRAVGRAYPDFGAIIEPILQGLGL